MTENSSERTDYVFNGAAHTQILTQEQQVALEAVRLEQHLGMLVEDNRAGFLALQRGGIQFDSGQLLSARIDTLIQSIADTFGPPGRLWALQARISFEELIRQQQAVAGEQGRKAQLGAAGSFTPAMIRQLAAETGTLPPSRR